MENDPLQEEIDNILRTEESKVIAEEAYSEAGMAVVAALESRTAMLAVIMKRAHDRGPEYLAAMLSSAIMMSRSLARGYCGDQLATFADYLKVPRAGAEAWEIKTAEYMIRFLRSDTLESSVSIATELQGTLRELPAVPGAKLALNLVRSSVQLVSMTLEQANILSLEHMRGEHDR